ncbi:multidrug ABC transporter permease [Planobispora rosea]|uniref:Multidrug ABC transporter permease n=1 Tax=Planobispora rosea TaxID=35762 RepID=A0A8J3S8G7_PLARO|nr:ABC transporter ATP-binding protein [Planobispora rosea]GGT03415.1 multidrug ABC transporter permease [Planobispora rosea]GIH88650.1 multidrug ABC transporter permease [Planobispora rosea]
MTGPGHRVSAAGAVRALGLAFRSAPATMTCHLAVTLLATAFPITIAWLTKATLDTLASAGSAAAVTGPVLGLVAVGLAAAALPQAGQYLRAEMDRRIGLAAQNELFRALDRSVGVGRLEDPAFLDRLRLAQQSAGSPGQLVDSAFGFARGALTLAGFVGSLALMNTLVTVLVLVAAIPALLTAVRLSRRRAEMLLAIGPTERREFFYADLLSSVDAAREVRLFGLGAFLRGRMLADRSAANDARRRLERRELVIQTALTVLSAGVSGAGLAWTVFAAVRGQLTVGDVSMFVAAVVGVQGALDALVGAMATGHQQLLMFGHYAAVVDAGPDLPVPADPGDPPALRHGIELRDVWFRYSAEHPWVLRGVNLFLPAGGVLALVGHNGSGKSTIVKLLCRFYDPTEGAILWDGVDIRQVSPERLRERIGAVFQDFMAYDFSAADNIALGDLTALGDAGRVETAARSAGAHETLSGLPLGYDTLLTRMFFSESDRADARTGVVLSGGQWQRVALARAFLRASRDLMILDEPSAGLDAEAEYEVHTRLRQIRAGRTSLLISHRLGAVRDADVIAMVVDGRVTERGTHDELVAADGAYARLFRLQAQGYSEETARRPEGSLK